MEDESDLVLKEQSLDTIGIANIFYAVENVRRAFTRQGLLLQVEEPAFVVIHADQCFRLEQQDLRAQFGADRSCCAGDHHHALRDQSPHRFELEFHRIASEQVLEMDLPEIS